MANANAGNPVGAPAQVAPPLPPPQQQIQQPAAAMGPQAQAAPLMEINEKFFSYMSKIAPSLNQVLSTQGVNTVKL